MKYATLILALVFAPTAARADIFDRVLVDQSAAVADAVRKLGAKNIAVLPFEATIAGRPATLSAGSGNVQLARRLQHLFILSNTSEPPMGVVGEPAAVRDSEAGWQTAAQREAQFKRGPRTLVWDNQTSVEPDAFVTGRVEISADMGHAAVFILGFTKEKPGELQTLYSLRQDPQNGAEATAEVALDRSALSAFGVSFSVARPAANFTNLDEPASQDAAKNVKTNDPPNGPGECPVQVAMLIDGTEAEFTPDLDSPGNVASRSKRLAGGSPQEGQAVTFKLTNTSDSATYGVLLAVDGANTAAFDGDTLDSGKPLGRQRLWVLKPGQVATVRGFYTETGSGVYKPFSVLSEEESAAKIAGLKDKNRAGRFQVRVFGKPLGEPMAVTGATEEEVEQKLDRATDNENLALGLASRGLSETRSLKEAQKSLAKSTKTMLTPRGLAADPNARPKVALTQQGLIAAGETTAPAAGGGIKVVRFEYDPQPLVSYDIVYHSEPAKE